MNHLGGPSEGEVSEEPASGTVNESVEADLERPEVEEEQRYATRYPRHTNCSQGGLAGQEEEGMLARSASTESGFHNHTDTAEGDVIATVEDTYDTERVQENEDESAYAVQYRPESEEYTENAEAEHSEAVHHRTLPNHLHFHSIEHEEAMNAAYSGYVYTHRLLHRRELCPKYNPLLCSRDALGTYIVAAGDFPCNPVLEPRLSARAQQQVGSSRRCSRGQQAAQPETRTAKSHGRHGMNRRSGSRNRSGDLWLAGTPRRRSPPKAAAAPGSLQKRHARCLFYGSPLLPIGRFLIPRASQPISLFSQERFSSPLIIFVASSGLAPAASCVCCSRTRYNTPGGISQEWSKGGENTGSPLNKCNESPSPDSSSPRGAESSSRQHHQDVCSTAEGSTNKESRKSLASFPTYVEVPGPCDPEDLIDGIIFAANYLGSTQLLSDKTPSKNVRMMQAQEAVSRIKMAQKLAKSRKKAPEGESQPMTEVDLFISTQRIKVLNADTQETMMDHPLRTISYIADIGNIVVLMARRRMPRSNSQDNVEASHPSQDGKRQYKMICHVFESEDAQLIAQSIGQAFSVAYQEFLRANGINPEDLSQKEYSDLLNTQDMYNDDLIHFSKSENCKDVYIEKQKGEILGVVIVESGWGSILPTVIIANMMHGGPAEKSGKLNIGDQIMSINGTSLVGLPLSTCQSIIKGLKNQARVKLNIVRCPPVTTVLIRRPDLRYQLGFSVQNGIICSLMRGGIAERGGVRVGHRIIEINGQSVVATPHEKIVHILSNAVGEIHMKTMPAAMYRLLTAQEQPVYI
ncbi:Amyloid beta A4 precursor protein-binding family A member 1 [Chaetura pelagica]|nr:Amyloid beta A4 precursor protein-binding family A member 1 [Chaetura pelagica]